MKYFSNLKKLFFLNILIFITCTSYFGLTSPVTLQKILSLRPVNDNIDIYNKKFKTFSELELLNFIENIPYKENEVFPFLSRGVSENSWSILPKTRYEDAILRGNGNCSNLVFGAMYHFNNSQKQASVWHLLPNDSSFLKAFGHTVLQINIDGVDTVVDILEGGTPLKNGQVINAFNSEINSSDIFLHRSLSGLKDNNNKYFTKNNLIKMRFGLIPQIEIEDYFSFINAIYFPLKSAYLEKIFFDSLSLFFGKYPKIYVSKEFLFDTFKRAKLETILAFLTFLSFHLFYLGFFVFIVKTVLFRIKKKIDQ